MELAALDRDLEPFERLGIALGADRGRAADGDDDVGRAGERDPVERRRDLEVALAIGAGLLGIAAGMAGGGDQDGAEQGCGARMASLLAVLCA